MIAYKQYLDTHLHITSLNKKSSSYNIIICILDFTTIKTIKMNNNGYLSVIKKITFINQFFE